MIAYNKTWLYNKLVQENASDAFRKNLIDADTYKIILTAKPNGLYTPPIFVKIGLFILTVVAVIAATLLTALVTLESGDYKIIVCSLLLFLASYAALEFFINDVHYNSGVDTALQICVLTFLATTFTEYPGTGLLPCFCLLIVALWMFIRFVDAFMGVVSFLLLQAVVFFLLLKTGDFGKMAAPFVLMITSGLVYYAASICSKKEKYILYQFSCEAIQVASLIVLYAAGNYYVVRELSVAMFDLQLGPNDTIPFGWVFWIFTIAIPFVYLIVGIKKRSMLLIRTALILVAAIVFTVRSYYAVMPIETAMTIGGLLLIAIAYSLVKYLSKPKHGYTFENTSTDKEGLGNVEAILIAEVLGKTATTSANNHQVKFGGGSSGGAGASGDF